MAYDRGITPSQGDMLLHMTMMVKLVKILKLHDPMIQFLIEKQVSGLAPAASTSPDI